MTTQTAVLHEKRDYAFWITINRPDKRNALNDDVIAGIREGYRLAHADGDVRVIVLTGAGEKAFCAGADLQAGKTFQFEAARPTLAYADMLRAAHAATLPAIARVNGACMAGGIGLLCMTDLAVAADHVTFGLPEVKVGVFPMQVLSLLQSLVPQRTVREWALAGEPFSAAMPKRPAWSITSFPQRSSTPRPTGSSTASPTSPPPPSGAAKSRCARSNR
jgi:methylglutaconyl-CoA hydratase